MYRYNYSEKRYANSNRQPSFFNLGLDDKKSLTYNIPSIKRTERFTKDIFTPVKTKIEDTSTKTQLSTTCYVPIELRLQEENQRLREEIISIKETFLKEKEDLINKIDKKNDIIYELNDHLNYYEARK